MKNLIYVTVLSLFILLSCSFIHAASIPVVYVNNKPFTGGVFIYGDTVYVEGATLLNFMNIPNSSTGTTLSINDTHLQEKLSKIAVWIDYNDGRGNIISFPLKTVAEVMGGRYKYYSDTNTVDMVSFSRNGSDTNKPSEQTTSGKSNKSHGVSAPNPAGHSSGDIVNPFNTSKILHDAQNSVNLYQDQNNGEK